MGSQAVGRSVDCVHLKEIWFSQLETADIVRDRPAVRFQFSSLFLICRPSAVAV